MSSSASGDGWAQMAVEEPDPDRAGIFREILAIALPNIAGYVMTLLNELTNTVVLGHSGSQAALAAVGLANMMQNCVGLSVAFGIAGALDTFVSQAHGAQEHELSCYYFQRCRVLMALQLIWMVPLLWFSGDLLALIHEDRDVALKAGEYNRASVFGLFAIFQFEASRKFLQNREDAVPPALICFATSVLHIGWCAFFVLHLDLGNAGAGYANAITWWTQFLAVSVYLARTARRSGFRKRSVLFVERPGLREWSSFMALALPATVQLCAEWWFWEICALIVGYLGKVALAAHTATLNWVAVCFMPTIGINASTAALVGNALGENLPRKAKTTAWMCVCTNLGSWTLLACGMVFARQPLSEIYSKDPDIQDLMQRLLIIFAAVGYCDSSQNVMGSALRGIGRQGVAAVTYLVAFYGVMLPGGVVAAFPLHAGIYGIWGSFGAGTSIAALIFVRVLCGIDYRSTAAEAARRMERERGALADSGASDRRLADSGASG